MRSRVLAVVAVTAALMIPVAGCASDHSTSGGEHASATATASGQAADIAFAQLMSPHHQQAVEMADLALDPSAQASPRVLKLAEQIKAAQDPEIETMTGWLEQWEAPTAMPGADVTTAATTWGA